MIPCWVYWSSFCFWWSIPFSIRYNYLYQLGYSLMQLPIWYSCIISGIFMPIIYPWCPRVIGWVSTQPCFFYSLDIIQSLSSWCCLRLSLINHILCLILRVQLLYSFVRNDLFSSNAWRWLITTSFYFITQYWVVSSILCWAHSEPSSSVLMSLWICYKFILIFNVWLPK